MSLLPRQAIPRVNPKFPPGVHPNVFYPARGVGAPKGTWTCSSWDNGCLWSEGIGLQTPSWLRGPPISPNFLQTPVI